MTVFAVDYSCTETGFATEIALPERRDLRLGRSGAGSGEGASRLDAAPAFLRDLWGPPVLGRSAGCLGTGAG